MNTTPGDIGACAYGAIVEMVAALECDYERLEELRDQETLTDEERLELAELKLMAGDCVDRDNALERIQDDPLSVEVRSGWAPVGDCLQAEEFAILLSTGGPAVRIRGELDEYRQPARAWLEVQDWGTPWTQYFGASQETLLTYASCFFFGEA